MENTENITNQAHNLDILQHFIFNNTDFEVTILWENGEPLFKALDIAKVLNIKKIHSSLIDFDEDEKVPRTTGWHGINQKTIFLTEIGLYRLLFNSRKKIAKPFQKWVAKIVREIQRNGFYQVENLKKELESAKKKEIESIEKAKHETYLNAFNKKRVVYFGKIREIDGKMLIKLGATKDIRNTFLDRHIRDYGHIKAIYVVECEANLDFEYFLLHHRNIRPFLYKNPVKLNGGCSIETILVSKNELLKVLNIVKRNRRNYPIGNSKITRLEEQMKSTQSQLNEQMKSTKSQLNEIKNLIVESMNKSKCNEDNTEIDSEENSSEVDSEILLSKMLSPAVEKKSRKRAQQNGTGVCSDCNTKISRRAKKCLKCLKRKKKFEISKDKLHKLVWIEKLPYTKIGKQYGVSDNAIRKRCKALGIDVRKRKKQIKQ